MNPIETLKEHNEWRRGSDTEMLNPTNLGIVIDTVIADYEAMQKQNNELRGWVYAVKEQAHAYEDTGVDEGLIAAIDSTPAQSLADIRAEAVIEAIEKCNASAQEEDNGERLIYISDLVDHASRIKEGLGDDPIYKPVVTVERVDDMCGGYVIARCGSITAIVSMHETPEEAIERVKRESKK